jgi:type II secretory pathway pseudopilin PulG
MKSRNKVGFTIVETMLVLGITGLLAMGIMVGVGSSIIAQRYRDSVTSLQSVLQQQYSEVSNVINENSINKEQCNGSDVTSRGQSECVIMGRYITTSDGQQLTINNVIGQDQGLEVVFDDDILALKAFEMKVSSVDTSTYDIEWDSKLVPKTSVSKQDFSMLIIKSPISGAVRTFLSDSPNSTIRDLLVPTALTKEVKLCVDPNNGLYIGTRMAVQIDANATGASGIQIFGDDSKC